MRNFAKVVCMMLVLLSLAVIAMASESSVVTQTRPITFHAERGIFLSAEIVNPWTDNQILKVVLPDSTILYRDLKTNEIWKEYSQGAAYKKSTTLTESEYNLITGIDLDTGWIPEDVPLQVRLVFVASLGEIVADLPGDIKITYDDDDIQIDQELDAQVGWDGDYYDGNLHMDAGLDFSAKWRVCLDFWPLYWCDSLGQDFVPPINYGFNTDCGFTPFLLDGTEYCNAPIISKDFMFPVFQIPFLFRIEIGAEWGGSVTG